ncbi:hypothetical protein MRB53_009874 [Persea americana]|uniref:Uncharacterized protein n=1 Tax=Persea americana TaxID=3435 RepID=A0ACC2LQA1_PERAE|nr:hypothetical protein MRB53_009874 [Persea americana]
MYRTSLQWLLSLSLIKSISLPLEDVATSPKGDSPPMEISNQGWVSAVTKRGSSTRRLSPCKFYGIEVMPATSSSEREVRVAQTDIDKTSSVCEVEFDLHSTDIGERCSDRCSDDENQTSSDDVELDDIIQFQDKPLAVVAQADSLEALAVERGFSDRGASGGILVLWNAKFWQKLDEFVSILMKDVICDAEWVASLVYGPNNANDRGIFWAELNQVAGSWNHPWVVGGDFNVIRHLRKKEVARLVRLCVT